MDSRYTDKTRAEVKRLYQQEGWSVAQISRKRGLPEDPKTIRRWLGEMGITLRGPSSTRKFPRAKILADLRAKIPRKKIQAKYGCSMKYLSLLANGEIAP